VDFYRHAGPLSETPQTALPSPGVGLRHYAPRARLVLVEGGSEQLAARLAQAAQAFAGQIVGVLQPEGIDAGIPGAVVYDWGSWLAPDTLAQGLYAGLRALDAAGCAVILCPVPAEGGVGAAIRDRLFKAAR
jgi:L-threonylcarbamoyladenylate synthase